MKKLISIVILALIISFSLFGCVKNNIEENSTTTAETATANHQTTVSNSTQNIQEDAGGGDILPDKYRLCYYDITYPFTLLVNDEDLNKWLDEIYLVHPNETNEMIMKRFIQDFDISREDFDKANENWALHLSQETKEVPIMNPQDYTNQEMWEVYNGDIIYTFDDEIINAYYLSHPYPFLYESEYEEAVFAGTYKTQTTDFYFPELDSHSCTSLRGFEYPDETATAISNEETTTVEQTQAAE